MYCPNCGKQIMDGAQYCPECGEDTSTIIPKRPVEYVRNPAPSYTSISSQSAPQTTPQTARVVIRPKSSGAFAKWWLWLIVLLAAAYTATVLNGAWNMPKLQFLIFWRDAPDKVVSESFDVVKAQDWTAARNYWGAGSFGGSSLNDEDTMKKVALVVKNLDYEIESEKINGKTATVTTKISNTDMMQIATELYNETLQSVLNNGLNMPEDADAQIEAAFERLMSREDNPKVSVSVEIPLKLVDDKWVIQPSDAIIDDMLGGMNAAADSLG